MNLLFWPPWPDGHPAHHLRSYLQLSEQRVRQEMSANDANVEELWRECCVQVVLCSKFLNINRLSTSLVKFFTSRRRPTISKILNWIHKRFHPTFELDILEIWWPTFWHTLVPKVPNAQGCRFRTKVRNRLSWLADFGEADPKTLNRQFFASPPHRAWFFI